MSAAKDLSNEIRVAINELETVKEEMLDTLMIMNCRGITVDDESNEMRRQFYRLRRKVNGLEDTLNTLLDDWTKTEA